MATNRNYYLDILKILGVFLVAFAHSGWWEGVLNHGYLPVEFFFIISGYFIYRTFTKCDNVGTFVNKKIIRLLPTWVVILSFYFVLYLFSPQLFSHKLNVNLFLTYVSQLCLTNDTGLLEILGIRNNVVYLIKGSWYVAEYFWGGILIFMILKMNRIRLYVLITIVTTFYTWIFIIADGGLNDYWGFESIFFIPLCRGVAGMSLGAIVGMILYNGSIKNYMNNRRRTFNLLASVCLLGSVFCCFTSFDLDWLGVICFIIIAINILMADGISMKFNKLKYANLVPDISLEILLLHKFATVLTVKSLAFVGFLEYNTFKYIAFILVTVSVAILFQKLIVPLVTRVFNSLSSQCIILFR